MHSRERGAGGGTPRARRDGRGGFASQQLSAAAVAAVLAEHQQLQLQAQAQAQALLLNSKEYFTSDRFQHGRAPNGEWRSRYRTFAADGGGGFGGEGGSVGFGGGGGFEWRSESKMRTVAGALTLCLNIGVDPPGVDRPSPCAHLECWIDPEELQPPHKSLERIGAALHAAYLRLQPKALFEQLLDPTNVAVKRMCVGLRNHAQKERVLFHYNGHGVPRPTTNGEIWVFDKNYTLYVPLSLDDLLTWLGGPAIIVLDCSRAGALLERFQALVKQRVAEAAQLAQSDPERAALLPDYSECIMLGCCSATQSLPLANPALPMDLFTACLTTPLRIALKVFALASPFGLAGGGGAAGRFERYLDRAAGEELLDKIPGKASDRKTALGELHWIYTAVTDTIAWNILPPSQFQRLFRQDMLLASLLRNFLLATRILAQTGSGCTTFSWPGLPHASLIAKHPLWASWELVLEAYLLALDKYLAASHPSANEVAQRSAVQAMNSMAAAAASAAVAGGVGAGVSGAGGAAGPAVGVQVGVAASPAAAAALAAAAAAASVPPAARFAREHVTFFNDHLTAFDLSLEVSTEASGPPVQLPIVLQVLLSQVHRRRALVLLARFMGKGSWAVAQALSVGIFPYVLKLLQSPDGPLRDVLVFIWSKLLALDRSVQADLVREGHEHYFVNHLASPAPAHPTPGGAQASAPLTDRQRVTSAFVLAALCDGFPAGQTAVLRTGVLPVLATHLESGSPSLRKWMCLLLGKLWSEHEGAKSVSVGMGLPEKLCGVIADPVPEVRAAALFALGTFMSSTPSTLYPGRGGHGVNASTATASASMSQSSSSSTSPAHMPSADPFPNAHAQVASSRERAALELLLAKNFSQLVVDASPLVREELVIALARLVEAQADDFVLLAHERIYTEDGSAAAAAGASSVPPSPLISGLSSPSLHPYPGAYHGYGHPQQGGSVSASATPAMGPMRSPSPPPAGAQGQQGGAALSVAVSPNNAGHPQQRVTTPLSPLQLQGDKLASTNNAWSAAAAAAAGAGGGSFAPSGQQLPRSSLTRAASASGVGSMSISASGPDAAAYQQRQLIWRVVRTLSHDPFPGVAHVAIALRKLVAARAQVLQVAMAMHSPRGGGIASSSISFAAPSYSSQQQQIQMQGHSFVPSVQGSPLIHPMGGGGMGAGALNTVPEQPLAGQEQDGYADGGSVTGNGARFTRTDSSAEAAAALAAGNFDAIVTRPRGGEHHHPPPPPQFQHPPAQSQPAPAGILGAGGVLSSQPTPQQQQQFLLLPPTGSGAGGSTSSGRAPSPQPQVSSRVNSSPASATASSSSSPLHQPLSGSSSTGHLSAPAQPGPRRSVNGSAADGAGASVPTMGMVGTPFSSLSSMANAVASIPPSSIYARSCEYFIAPVGAVAVNASASVAGAGHAAGQAAAVPSSFETADRVLEALLTEEWRRKRNQNVLAVATSLRADFYDVHERGTFEQVAALSTGFEQVSALLFHPFEPLLVVAEKRQVGVWDAREMERVNVFSNENARGSKLSALQWLNDQHVSLLLAGSDDGVVRLWKGVHVRDTAPELVSAWLAVRSMPRGNGVGLVLDWQQETGHLLAAGPVDSIRVWDVEREICVLDLPVDSDSYVSSVCSASGGGVVYAGCGDGVVRMYDLRADSHTIHNVSKHAQSVVTVKVQQRHRWSAVPHAQGGMDFTDGDLISGGVNGDIHLSDTRMLGQSHVHNVGLPASALHSSVVRSMAAFDKAGLPLDALAVHEHAPLFAAGSRKQVVRIADFRSSPGGPGTLTAPPGATATSRDAHTNSGVAGGAGVTSAMAPAGSPSRSGSLSSGLASSPSPAPLGSGSFGVGAGVGSLGGNPTGATVSTLKYFKGFMGHRLPPVSEVVFHPTQLQLAVGGAGTSVSIFEAGGSNPLAKRY